MGSNNNGIAHGAILNIPNPAALNGGKRMQYFFIERSTELRRSVRRTNKFLRWICHSVVENDERFCQRPRELSTMGSHFNRHSRE
jgi:hypothetical protein